MCLEKTYFCNETSGVGYKVVQLDNKSVFFGKFNYSPGSVLEDVSNTRIMLYDTKRLDKYLTGFHCFLYEKDAKEELEDLELITLGLQLNIYKIIKLRWYKPTVFGFYHGIQVVVARKIVIDKDYI